MKIGFLDSGLGGLTILSNIYNDLNCDFIYLADNLNAPYGTKSVNEVQALTESCVKKLINLGCNIIVVACNTATSAAISFLRNTYININFIGTEPAIRPALAVPNHKKVILTATSLTLKEKKLKVLLEELHAQDFVELLALDELVKYADQTNTIQHDKAVKYLEKQFCKYDLNDFSGIVLGCTHFPIFIDDLKKITPSHISFFDSADGIKRNLKKQILKVEPNYDFVNHNKSLEILLSKEDPIFRTKCLNLIYENKFF